MKKLFLIILILGSFFSCNDRLEELNRPKKNAVEVPGNALFNNGLRNMADLMASTDVNSNVFRLYAQYWAQTTYPDESQYNMVGREIPDWFWTYAYRDVLKDLDEAQDVIEDTWEDVLLIDEATKNNQIAIIDICKVYMYSVLVDVFGAIPYEESMNDEILSPAYEEGEVVYDKLIELLDQSLATLNPEAGTFETDLLFDGDIEAWQRFGNSLKLRLAMNIADVNSSKSQTMVTEAVNGGLILTNEQNAVFEYETAPPNTNPIWEDLVQSGRADYVVANTLVDVMDDLDDPRLAIYAQPVGGTGTSYVGGVYGTANAYDANSPAGTLIHQPDLPGVLIDAAEVNFLLAEAAARGFAVPGTVEEYYNEGIRQSIQYWDALDENVEITEGQIEAYIAQPEVAYATAAGERVAACGSGGRTAVHEGCAARVGVPRTWHPAGAAARAAAPAGTDRAVPVGTGLCAEPPRGEVPWTHGGTAPPGRGWAEEEVSDEGVPVPGLVVVGQPGQDVEEVLGVGVVDTYGSVAHT